MINSVMDAGRIESRPFVQFSLLDCPDPPRLIAGSLRKSSQIRPDFPQVALCALVFLGFREFFCGSLLEKGSPLSYNDLS